jgi:hypothetical protein
MVLASLTGNETPECELATENLQDFENRVADQAALDQTFRSRHRFV